MASPMRTAFRMPLRVENRISSPDLTKPRCHSTWAEARVAWPHKSTSATGVNQRRSKPSAFRTKKAVSDRFISLPTACSQRSSFHDGRRQTAAGFPERGRSVKASTWKRGRVMLLDSSSRATLRPGELVGIPKLQPGHADDLLRVTPEVGNAVEDQI